MVVALMSDIHGNALAVEAVIAAIDQLSVDRIICLGDVCAFGAQPIEALELIKQHNIPTVMGNTDAWLLKPPDFPEDNEAAQRVKDQLMWCQSQLDEQHRRFIRSFTPTLEVQLNEHQNLLCYHGSPKSFDDIILPSTPDDELSRHFNGYQADVYAGGHTHFPMYRRMDEKTIVNTGSVGLPSVSFPPTEQNVYLPYGEYVVLRAEGKRLSIEFKRVTLNTQEIRDTIDSCGAPHSEYWLDGWTT